MGENKAGNIIGHVGWRAKGHGFNLLWFEKIRFEPGPEGLEVI